MTPTTTPTRIRTRYFGELDVDLGDCLEFVDGLPGLPGECRFAPLSQERNRPLLFLQSVRDAALCFVAAPAHDLAAEYRFGLNDRQRAALALTASDPLPHDLLALALLAFREDGAVTANLLSPVIVNPSARRAVQAIQTGSGWSHEHEVARGFPCW